MRLRLRTVSHGVVRFSPSTLVFRSQCHSTNAPSCTRCSYQDKRAKPRNLPMSNVISEIREYWVEKYRVFFFLLSKGYHHCDRLSSSRHRLLNSPTRGVRRNAGGGLGRRLWVKQKKKHALLSFFFMLLRINECKDRTVPLSGQNARFVFAKSRVQLGPLMPTVACHFPTAI
jgi:hypothetical protein